MTEAKDFQQFNSSLIVNSVFNTFLSYTAVMLNVITIHALRKTSSFSKPLKTLLLSLAVSDLGVGLLVQPWKVTCLVMRLKENTKNNPTYEITNNVQIVTAILLGYASFFGIMNSFNSRQILGYSSSSQIPTTCDSQACCCCSDINLGAQCNSFTTFLMELKLICHCYRYYNSYLYNSYSIFLLQDLFSRTTTHRSNSSPASASRSTK